MNSTKCRICANTEDNTIYQVKEMMFGSGDTFTYFQCGKCKCLQIRQLLEDPGKYYPENYYSLQPIDESSYSGLKWTLKKKRHAATLFPHQFSDKVLSAAFPTRQYELLTRFKLSQQTRLLDVGCGVGYYLYPLYEIGMEKIIGIDPFIAKPITYANGLQIFKKDIYSITGLWDIITYHHAFEHVPDPLENLQAVAALLSDQGVCIIRIPTVSSFAWEHYKTQWFQIDAPRHTFIHSVESMQYLAAQAGLKVDEVVYDSSYNQFMMSEQYGKGIPYIAKLPQTFMSKMRRKLKKRMYVRKANQLNKEKRGDQAAFILSKL